MEDKYPNVSILTPTYNRQKFIKLCIFNLVNQIYLFAEKKIIVVSDIGFSENYLIYIDRVKNVTIDDKSDEYQKYLNLSKAKLVSELYNTYDSYIKKRYKIEINNQALDVVKNYFN